jgi:flagellin
MSVINTNVSALQAQNSLASNARAMGKAMQSLATGSRINSAGDDAAGLAIGQTLTSQIRGLNQAVRNANDGINLLQTAEGSLVAQTDMLQRMRELAIQAANGTVSSKQRDYLQTEYSQLSTQIGKINSQTTWNSSNVLSATTLTFQVGSLSGQTISVVISATTVNALSISGTTLAGASGGVASSALARVDSALTKINTQRATIGAGINRLTYAADNLTNISSNLSASRSTIMDTDYATASTSLSRAQIIQQAATAMLAQANQQPQSVLALLK